MSIGKERVGIFYFHIHTWCVSMERIELFFVLAFWIALAFTTMLMPAVVCFSKLKRDKRHVYRNPLTEHQKALVQICTTSCVISNFAC